MRVQEHVKLSTAVAVIVVPWLGKDTWIPFAASVLIDVDHYVWHAITYRSLSLRAAIRYFGQADPPQLSEARLLHHPLILGALLFLAVRLHSRLLALILGGLLFHVCLDAIHMSRMNYLKWTLSQQASLTCSECGQQYPTLQLHTIHVVRNLLDRYNPKHFIVLCPSCHELAHKS